MDEIKDLLKQWKEEGLVNPGSLESAYDAIALLVAKVEELENQIKDLSS
jgi:hypothetical protein